MTNQNASHYDDIPNSDVESSAPASENHYVNASNIGVGVSLQYSAIPPPGNVINFTIRKQNYIFLYKK